MAGDQSMEISMRCLWVWVELIRIFSVRGKKNPKSISRQKIFEQLRTAKNPTLCEGEKKVRRLKGRRTV